ncbi:hypothetical protein JCM11641_001478 [Rhodosporidiobolus odoratus]
MAPMRSSLSASSNKASPLDSLDATSFIDAATEEDVTVTISWGGEEGAKKEFKAKAKKFGVTGSKPKGAAAAKSKTKSKKKAEEEEDGPEADSSDGEEPEEEAPPNKKAKTVRKKVAKQTRSYAAAQLHEDCHITSTSVSILRS